MRKLMLLMCVTVVLPLASMAQSVLGIEFGSSYEVVKKALQKRYGSYEVREENGELHIYGDLQMGGFYFGHALFSFQRSATNTYFNYARFEKRYGLNEIEKVKRERDLLFSLLKDKYEDTAIPYIDDAGFKGYFFGDNPKDEESYLGSIYVSRDENRKGEMSLWINLSYGPIYYLPKSSDF